MRALSRSTLCITVVLAACAKADAPADSTTAAMNPVPPAPPAPAAISLAEVAGTWNTIARPAEGTDTTSTPSTLTATADTTGWFVTVGGQKTPVHVRVDGDSIMITSEPYNSVRRKGVKVVTTGVHRLVGGKLVGTTVAHYSVKTADSVLRLTVESTKAP